MPQSHEERLVAVVASDDGLNARAVLRELPGSGEEADRALDALAAAAAGGSHLAVELLVEQLDERGLARAAVRRFLVDEAAVDDVSQDTLVAAATSIHRFRGDAKLTTWLHQIARYRVTDHLRRQRATVALDEQAHGPALRVSSIIASRHAIAELLNKLPEDYRAAVTLRDVDQLSYAEVAERLDRNVNTVKSHVARGRALLATMLGGEALL